MWPKRKLIDQRRLLRQITYIDKFTDILVSPAKEKEPTEII